MTSLVGPASSRLGGPRARTSGSRRPHFALAKNLRYERAGAKLVEALKVRGRAVPVAQALPVGPRARATHEFATTLGGAVDAARRASLDDASALAYLRGDDVDAVPPSGEPGDQCLVAHGGRALGLAKVLKGGRLKNQLPRDSASGGTSRFSVCFCKLLLIIEAKNEPILRTFTHSPTASRGRGARLARSRWTSIPVVTGCAPLRTRRADPFRLHERRHGLAEIVERGCVVFVERFRRKPLFRRAF